MMTDTQDADAGGRWRWFTSQFPELTRIDGDDVTEYTLNDQASVYKLCTDLDALEARLAAAETARREAEQRAERAEYDRDTLAVSLGKAKHDLGLQEGVSKHFMDLSREAEQERDRLQRELDDWKANYNIQWQARRDEEADKHKAEARAAAAEAELAAFREKARLADEYRKSRTNMVLMGMPLSASEKSWCDRYDALTPTHESDATASQDADAGGRWWQAKDPMYASHKLVQFPRGDHAITVHLCHDCDNWHADDDSVLVTGGKYAEHLNAAETARREAEQERDRLRYDLPGLLNEQDRVEQELRTTLAQAEAKAALATEQLEAISAVTLGSTELRMFIERTFNAEADLKRKRAALLRIVRSRAGSPLFQWVRDIALPVLSEADHELTAEQVEEALIPTHESEAT